MIPKECRRLAEVDFPIAVVGQYSSRATRGGQPSTLHLWWARRPLAACRGMLLAILLPDPSDPGCPDEFKVQARKILSQLQGPLGSKDTELRGELLRFVGNFAGWENCSKPAILDAAHSLLAAAYGEEHPLVADTFAGGGSISLEALRLRCDAFASDLNPVAVLILKVLLEDLPRGGQGLANELRTVAAQIQKEAQKGLRRFYPLDQDGATPCVYLWARTITCDHCGAELPLIRSFWLSKKANRKLALRPIIRKPARHIPHIEFEIFKPKKESDVMKATVARAKATCIRCNAVTPPERVRLQLVAQRGGASPVFDNSGQRTGGARLLAVVVREKGTNARRYRLPASSDYRSLWRAQSRLSELGGADSDCSIIPTEELSYNEIRRVSVPLYGATRWHDLFTRRQCLTIVSYQQAAKTMDMSAACRRLIALAQDRIVMLLSAHCRWKASGESLIDMFGRHAIGIVWDFAEGVPGENESSIFCNWIDQYCRLIVESERIFRAGQVMSADACHHPLPDHSCDLWFTDPPYYDSIPYAHLSDCFYVWLKRSGLRDVMPAEFAAAVTPKEAECVVDRPHRLSKSTKDSAFFERSIALAAREGRRIISEDGAACIVFAHKSTEGWEALLSGIVDSGWRVTASWPIATELASRLNARHTASLNTSVHLVCRPRPDEAAVGDWAEVLHELPLRIGTWVDRLQQEGVRGADLVFACIGPAMEIYSRYRRVEDAEGHQIPLGGDPTEAEPCKRGFLTYVWETVGRLALEEVLGTAEARARNGGAGALEEDSRLTALFLWTLQTTDPETSNSNLPIQPMLPQITGSEATIGDIDDEDTTDEEADGESDETPKKKKAGYSLIYDVARRFAQPLGIHLEKWEGRIIETEKGVVRLLSIGERAKHLFGEMDATAVSHRVKADIEAGRNYLDSLAQHQVMPHMVKPRRGSGTPARLAASISPGAAPRQVTTLDRVHAAMLLHREGQTDGLHAMVKEEMQRGSDFLRLANALSRLYPKDGEEKRLLDAMLQAIRKPSSLDALVAASPKRPAKARLKPRTLEAVGDQRHRNT